MDLFSNVVAGISLFISAGLAVYYVLDRQHAKFTIENEYATQLLTWHADVVEVLIALQSHSTSADTEHRTQLLAKLSALIEQGRFYFPNIPSSFGAHKPPAYRGYRNLALDFLVASYNLHRKPPAAEQQKQANDLQRLFTSVVFEVVRPAERLKKIRKLTDRYFVQDLSVEDLEDPDQLRAISPMWERPSRER